MFTRLIYPLFLREKISWKIKKYFPNINDKTISLEFDKEIKLNLLKTDVAHQSIIFNGFYELGLTKTILNLGKKGGVFIDVGANYGYFSCLWASQNPRNSVLAFEASPVNVQPLSDNVIKNKLSERITIIPIALGKEKGILKFDLNNDSDQTGWGGLTINEKSSSIDVEVTTLDDYAEENNINKVEVLKIDTEGADTWVLYGAKNLLKEKKINHVFFENNISRMNLLNIDQNEARIFLEKLDYKVKKQSLFDFYAYPNPTIVP